MVVNANANVSVTVYCFICIGRLQEHWTDYVKKAKNRDRLSVAKNTEKQKIRKNNALIALVGHKTKH